MADFISRLPEYLVVALAVIGGLRVVAQYTPWKWDDKLFSSAENFAKKAQEFFPKKKSQEDKEDGGKD